MELLRIKCPIVRQCQPRWHDVLTSYADGRPDEEGRRLYASWTVIAPSTGFWLDEIAHGQLHNLPHIHRKSSWLSDRYPDAPPEWPWRIDFRMIPLEPFGGKIPRVTALAYEVKPVPTYQQIAEYLRSQKLAALKVEGCPSIGGKPAYVRAWRGQDAYRIEVEGTEGAEQIRVLGPDGDEIKNLWDTWQDAADTVAAALR